MVLLSARPFRVGERIRLQAGALGGQVEGIVSSLGLLYTTLARGDDRIMIPNNVVLSAVDRAAQGARLGRRQGPADVRRAPEPGAGDPRRRDHDADAIGASCCSRRSTATTWWSESRRRRSRPRRGASSPTRSSPRSPAVTGEHAARRPATSIPTSTAADDGDARLRPTAPVDASTAHQPAANDGAITAVARGAPRRAQPACATNAGSTSRLGDDGRARAAQRLSRWTCGHLARDRRGAHPPAHRRPRARGASDANDAPSRSAERARRRSRRGCARSRGSRRRRRPPASACRRRAAA